MAAWIKLHRFKKYINKHELLVVKFKRVWTHGDLFCKDIGNLLWQIVPNLFIPKHMVDYKMVLFIRLKVQMYSN